MEYDFWFCSNDIKCFVNDNKNKYALDWPIVPSMWNKNIGK